jgi:hypothetical protein
MDVALVGESVSTSSSTGGADRGWTDDGIGIRSGEYEGGSLHGSEAGQERGERRSSPSPSKSRRSSTLLHRPLVLLAGDDAISGLEGGGGARVGGM